MSSIVIKSLYTGSIYSLLGISLAYSANKDLRPNILLILADDLGYGDLSCQQVKDLQTPNIDHIFSDGVRFTNAYANSTVSSPSRAALMTGRYPDFVGVPGVIRTNENDSWGYLSPEAVLLPQLLKTVGYHTALVGKWHLGLEAPNLPNLRGFDEFYGFLGDMMEDYYTHIRDKNNYMRVNQKAVSPTGHATDIFADWALNFIERQQKQKDPFFLYLAFNAPHDPIQPPKEWLDKVLSREKDISAKRAGIVALIEHLDYNIGRILELLKKTGQIDNTLIIFASDNGGNLNFAANNGLYRGGKGDLYEGGLRIPAGMMWKEVIHKGSVSDNLILLMDIFPTICEIAKVNLNYHIDGISLLPLLQGKVLDTQNRIIYFMRREGGNYGGSIYYSARSGNNKILQNTPWEPIQFFNLREDPYETNPLSQKSAEYQHLFKQLTEHVSRSGCVPWKSRNQVIKLTQSSH